MPINRAHRLEKAEKSSSVTKEGRTPEASYLMTVESVQELQLCFSSEKVLIQELSLSLL